METEQMKQEERERDAVEEAEPLEETAEETEDDEEDDDDVYHEPEYYIAKASVANRELMQIFKDSMEGLTKRTIWNHLYAVRLYLNFMERYGWVDGLKGWDHVDCYLGNYYIRRGQDPTPPHYKKTVGSILKFYRALVDCGKFPQENYEQLRKIIKENTEEWLYRLERYTDWEEPMDADELEEMFVYFDFWRD